MSTNRELILSCARRVRAWTKRQAHKYYDLSFDERTDSQDGYYEIDPSDLMGGCAIASTRLFLELQKLDIPAELCVTHTHAFLVVEGHILDVTATQFKPFFAADEFPPIVFETEYDFFDWFDSDEECADLDQEPWANAKRFSCVNEFLKYLDQEGWPQEQTIQKKHLNGYLISEENLR